MRPISTDFVIGALSVSIGLSVGQRNILFLLFGLATMAMVALICRIVTGEWIRVSR